MQLSNIPGKLVLPFANAGGKNAIPVDSQIGITAGAASLVDGFPPLTRTPIAAGGVPPSGLDMNGIIYELSAVIRWANAGGGYPFDSAFATDTNVGGYPKGARIMRADGAGYWYNTTDNNVTDPESSGAAAAGWVPDFTTGVAAVTMTSANVTLTPAQYGKPTIVITGALTGNLNLIFPNITGQWDVINSTTGGYTITAKTAAGVGATIPQGFLSAVCGDGSNIYSTFDSLRAATGSTLVGHKPSGVNSKLINVFDALNQRGRFASDFIGYDATGGTDSTAAIQAAIDAANADGTHTVFITGKPTVTAPLTYSTMLALIGVGGGDIFSNNFDAYPTRINCNAVTGYLFDQPDVVNGSGALAISNIAFDGRNAALVKSSTWQGLVKAATTPGTSSFFLRLKNIMVGNSLSPTSILNLSGEVFGKSENCFYANWFYGYGAQTSGGGVIGTTFTFEKCYWNSLRQVAEFYDNQTDVQFNDCVMESCVVGVAALKTNVTFNQLYSENMGYDASGTGITTGLTPRSFGIADSPAISGNVTAVHTCRYGQLIFNSYTIQNTTGGKKWFDGIGRSSALGQGGLIELNDISFAAGSINTIFTADSDSPTSKANFEYKATCKVATAVFAEADARILNSGRVNIQYSDGTLRPTEVNAGRYTLPALSFNGITTMPTAKYPNGGSWQIGDVIKLAPSTGQQGYPNSYICSVAGTTSAGWDINGFIPSSKTASVAAAGTMQVNAAQMNTGDLHVWEILASDGANIKSFYRVSMEAFTGVGQLFVESLVTTNTLTFGMTWGGPYTITITNTSGATLSIYARLVSMTSTHS